MIPKTGIVSRNSIDHVMFVMEELNVCILFRPASASEGEGRNIIASIQRHGVKKTVISKKDEPSGHCGCHSREQRRLNYIFFVLWL